MTKSTDNARDQSLDIVKKLEKAVADLTALQHLQPNRAADELAVKDAVLGPINDLEKAIVRLSSEQSAFIAQQQAFMNFAMVNNLIPLGPFLQRYYYDHPQEKEAIAKFVTEKFFSRQNDPPRCFVQASTLALRLAYTLDNDPTIHQHSLIHTNSAVAHLPLLYGHGNGRIAIWPFCSRSFDPVCAGWQMVPGDDDAASYVRSLFTREKEPLRTAILMPVYVTPRDGVYYERTDAAQFARVLLAASEVIILATGNRLIGSPESIPDDRRHNGCAAYRDISDSQRSKITLVATHPTDSSQDLRNEFRTAFGTVHWCHPDGCWEQL